MSLSDIQDDVKKVAENNSTSKLAETEQNTSLSGRSVIDKAIAERQTAVSLNMCKKIPLAEVTALGGSFAKLEPSIKRILTGTEVKNGSVVRVVFPNGIHGRLAQLKDTGETIGGILTKDGSLAQARLKPIELDPASVASMAMAAVLVEINHKLDVIQETQIKILSFLEQDKQAEQKANLNTLVDILKNYKYNWDNEQYLHNQHTNVLNIKRAAEKNIIFYQEQIAAAIKKMPAVYMDQAVKGAITDLGKLFSNYRMALYAFAFATFLEVMLLRNFRQEYLDQTAAKVQEYNAGYQDHYKKCQDLVKKFSSDSVETKVVAGLGNASRALGKLIGSSPILARGPVDEWLQEGGEKLLKGNDKKVARTAAMFIADDNNGSKLFVDSIKNVAVICNKTTDILFDGEALYLAGV